MTNLWQIIDVTKIWTWPCFSLILKLWCDLFVKTWKIYNCIASKVWNSFATHYIWISLQYHLLSLCNTYCQIMLHSTISFVKPLQYILSNIVAFKCEGNWKHNDHFKYLECKHFFLSPFLLNVIVVTYEIRVFFKGVQKEVFSSILEYAEQVELKLCPNLWPF